MQGTVGASEEESRAGGVREGLWNPVMAVEGEPHCRPPLGLGTGSRPALCALGQEGLGQGKPRVDGRLRVRKGNASDCTIFTKGQTLISGNWQNGCSKKSQPLPHPPPSWGRALTPSGRAPRPCEGQQEASRRKENRVFIKAGP